MYKIIAIDLDGTLLNSKGDISSENRNAIKLAKEKGLEIVLCSGRITSSVQTISLDIGADNYLISGNGAELYDIKNKKILYDNYMSKETTLKLIEFCEENSIYYSIFTENSILTKALNYNVLVYNSENSTKEINKRTNINITQNIYEYIKNSKTDKFAKITICDNNKTIFNGIINKLRNIKNIEVLDVAHMSNKTINTEKGEMNVQYYYTEVTSKNVNKWNALIKLAEKLNVNIKEIACIGDNINDKEMIQKSGLGIVMGNSAPYIKEIGDIVVETNNNNGVAEAIEKYCLN